LSDYQVVSKFKKAKAPAATTAPTVKLFCIDLVMAQLIPPDKAKDTVDIINLLVNEVPCSFSSLFFSVSLG
jgi:hypothetical protein